MVNAVIRVRVRGECMGMEVGLSRISAYMVEYAMERRGVSRKMVVCIWW